MPLADFAGSRNWGYDGVLWYAPDSAYGRPDDLKALIDEAHLRGLMVFLDVVYNHFGPEGNYLGRYAPGFFTEAQTPWGSAIDYRVPEVRAFAIENALYWLREYRFDGLRLDAVNTIVETGEISILHDLSVAAGKLAAETGRHIHLVLENSDNRASLLDATQDPPRGKYRAQWNDDYHHAWHVLLTGEAQGYYGDYQRFAAQRHCARACVGLCLSGRSLRVSRRQARGEPSGELAPTAFVNFLQNHDQIGNRALGDRLESIADPRAIEAALAITLLAPDDPMLFMGEEWGSKAPFPFFCDFKGDLAEAVRKGRRSEYAWAYAKYGDEVPDPLAQVDLSIRGTGLGIARRGAGTKAAGAGARPARDTPARDRSAACGRGVRRCACGGQRLADGELAHGRRRDAAVHGQPVESRDRRARQVQPAGTPIWGGESRRRDAAVVGVLAHRRAMMPPAIPIATYRLQLTAELRFRRGGGDRPLSESAGHHASLCLALHEGAQGLYPWL